MQLSPMIAIKIFSFDRQYLTSHEYFKEMVIGHAGSPVPQLVDHCWAVMEAWKLRQVSPLIVHSLCLDACNHVQEFLTLGRFLLICKYVNALLSTYVMSHAKTRLMSVK